MAERTERSIYLTGEYLDHNPDWHAGDAPHKARWIDGVLARNALAPRRIGEIGSGSGEILVELANRHPETELHGYDISPQAHAIAAPKGTERLHFHCADMLVAPPAPFDLLLVIDVFEHVPDYCSFVRAVKPLATWKMFHIPLDLSVQGLLRGTMYNRVRQELGHLHYFFKDTALATLEDCGHEIVDWTYTFSDELPNRRFRKRMLDGVRRLVRPLGRDATVRLLGGASLMVLTR